MHTARGVLTNAATLDLVGPPSIRTCALKNGLLLWMIL